MYIARRKISKLGRKWDIGDNVSPRDLEDDFFQNLLKNGVIEKVKEIKEADNKAILEKKHSKAVK